MAIDYIPSNLYVPLQGVQTLFNDKLTGTALVGGYLKFYVDPSFSTAKDVYILTQSVGPVYTFTNVGSTITLGASGSPVVSNSDVQIYLYPYDEDTNAVQLYSMEVYNSDDVLQFTRFALPSNVAGNQQIDNFQGSDNQIENSQFVITNLPNTLTQTFSVTGTGTVTEIAPDWSIVTSGSGSVVVTQVPLQNISMPTGAPYAIEIDNSDTNITSLKLRQTISESPRIFFDGSTAAYAYGSLVAKSNDSVATLLVMDYVPSSGDTINLVNGSTSADGDYNTISNTTASLIESTNANSPLTPGYVNIDITIPSGRHVSITSVQVVSVESADSTTPYVQESVPRQIDHLFHYYNDSLQFKPIPSLLTGWDFPLNPRQRGTFTTLTSTADYVMDQTIMKSVTGNVALTQSSTTGGVNLVNASAGEAVLLLQYLSGAEAQKILGTTLSSNVESWSTTNDVTVRVYMYRGSSSAVFPTLPNLIGSLANTGVFTKNDTAGQGANWTLIARGNLGQAIGTVAQVATSASLSSTDVDLGFWGWEVTDGDEINDTDKYAIIVTYQIPTISTTLQIQSISTVPGNIPTRPAPLTFQETLDDCQYYFRTSFFPGTTNAAGQALNNGETLMGQFVGSSVSGALGMIVQWDKPMINTPDVLLYTPVTSGALLYNVTTSLPWVSSTVFAEDRSGFYVVGTTPASGNVGSVTACNWTADARLGKV